MNPFKRSIDTMALLLVLFLVGCILSILPFKNWFGLRSISSFYFLALGIALTLYFAQILNDPKIRQALIAMGCLIVFWFFVRVEKYVAFEESELVIRYLWYAYYIPMLLIPQISLQTVLSMGTQTKKRLSWFSYASGVISIVLLGLVLTNDLHQWVFRFLVGFVNTTEDYTYGPVYLLICIWDYASFLAAITTLLHKCSLSASRKLTWIPVFYVTLFVVWMVLTALQLRPQILEENFGEFPETACFLMGGFWMLCISIGLVPSSKGYGKLFSVFSLAAQISDEDFQIAYRSPSMAEMTRQQLESEGPVLPDKNTRIHRQPVSGGYAYWQTDLTELNRIHAELEAVQEALSEEGELLRLENELKEKRAQIAAKTKVYDAIAIKVSPQSRRIDVLTAQAKENPALFDQNMGQICIYAAYIKRMANLMLLASEAQQLSTRELLLSIQESARYLTKTGIPAMVTALEEEWLLSASQILFLYEQFEALLEQALPTLRGLHAALSAKQLKLTLEGAVVMLPAAVAGTAEVEEDTTFLRLDLVEQEAAL